MNGLSLFALSALVSAGVVGASVWGLTSSLQAMHQASRALSKGPVSFSSPLELRVASTDVPRFDPVRKPYRASRVQQPTERDLRGTELTAAAIRFAHERTVIAEIALAELSRKVDETKNRPIAPITTPTRSLALAPVKPVVTGSVVTALLETGPTRGLEPFDQVLAKPEADPEVSLLGPIPVPEARPLIEAALPPPKPKLDKPQPRKTLQLPDDADAPKAERSLFGELFANKPGNGSWPGAGSTVAVYDVSNASVYLPDGTKLRAHSGIGSMRDKPQYENVRMRGPTPAGIYRLSMRETRFYGVEAIRMTSIDGRDPKNRTGLLTHTNLLRGQIGSHGCVAFQNYQPFLNAFKSGRVKTLVVVPQLPSSQAQLAELYRKAGA